MNIRNIWMSAAVAGLLAASGMAHAQLLGGGASGGLGGSIAGGVGNPVATVGGTLGGSLHGGTDALGRTREFGARTAGRVKETADDATGAATATADDATLAGANVTGDADAAASGAAEPAQVPRKKAGTAKHRAQEAPADRERAPTAMPEPKAHAGGKANGNNSLSLGDDEPAAAQGDADAGFSAGVER